jgi:hypothetical protein
MKKLALLIAIVALNLTLNAQTVVMKQNVLADSAKSHFGPNQRNYVNTFISFGFVLGPSENAGSAVNYGISNHFDIGIRYKLKLCNHYALGTEVSYNMHSYNLKQEKEKTFPDTLVHKKESYTDNAFELGIFQRINYGRRGNYMGNYIDMGAYGSYVFSAVNFTKDKLDNGNVVRTKISHLNYYEPLGYGFFARLGFNRYVIYAKYRMTDVFVKSCSYPELPRFVAGIQIGLHK